MLVDYETELKKVRNRVEFLERMIIESQQNDLYNLVIATENKLKIARQDLEDLEALK